MKVLISFITRSDPWKEESTGPAVTVTTALALNPGAIHLLYTDKTKDNFTRTQAYLNDNTTHSKIYEHKLDLPDVTDYQQLKEMLPKTLGKIRKQHPGGHFYLVSGTPQPRFIFSLCLTAQVVDGILLEVQRPDETDPWPKSAEGYRKRLKELDLEFFQYFRQLFLEKYKCVRMRLDLGTEDMWLDNKRLDFRARVSESSYEISSRTFKIMALLSAKKLYANEDKVTKNLIRKHIYMDTSSPDINIPRSITKINNQAKLATEKSSKPINNLISSDGKGIYWLTDELMPVNETIEIIGDLNEYLCKMKLQTDYFPLLS